MLSVCLQFAYNSNEYAPLCEFFAAFKPHKIKLLAFRMYTRTHILICDHTVTI